MAGTGRVAGPRGFRIGLRRLRETRSGLFTHRILRSLHEVGLPLDRSEPPRRPVASHLCRHVTRSPCGASRWYEVDSGDAQRVAVASTRMTCAQPAGVMAQEQEFLQALQTVATARIEPSRIELRRADGALAVSLVKD